MDKPQSFGVLIEILEYDEPMIEFYTDSDQLYEAFKGKCRETYENEDQWSKIYIKWGRYNEHWPGGLFHSQSYSYPDDDFKEMFDEWSSEEEDSEENESGDDEESEE